jgi:hypothetical protein
MLSEELDGKRVKLANSTYQYKPEHVLINWGNGNCPFSEALNPASAILDVIDKRKFFEMTNDSDYVPNYATTKTAAAALKFPVVCRGTTEGHDGQGITIAETPAQLTNAPLYVEYIDKTSEYRIHVGRLPSGEVTIIGRQKKYKTENFTGDGRIWTGQETKLEWMDLAPIPVIAAAKAVFAMFPKLTFGAFDIVYDNSSERAYVLEINSAPMMTTQSTVKYAEFFRNFTPTTTSATVVAAAQATQEVTTVNTTQSTPTTTNDVLTNLVKTQIAQGHISQQTLLSAYKPKEPSQDELIANYVTSLTA